MLQCGGDGIDDLRIDQRLIALDVDDPLAIATRCNLGDAIRATRMIRRGHLHVAKILNCFENPRVIGGNDDPRQAFCPKTPLNDVVD